MLIFIDTANLNDIEEALKRGFIRGVTTNPSLLAKEPKGNFNVHIGKIADLIKKYQPEAHLSVEVFSRDPKEILKQAIEFKRRFKLNGLSVKIQIGWNELSVIRELSKKGISVNCTCNMSISQAVMAASAGAEFVSLFWGRIRDGGFDPAHAIAKTRDIFNSSYPETKIIAGSMRGVNDVIDAGLAGAHIVTVPPKFFPDMISHFKTDEVIGQFLTDFQKWMK
jgi:transaldolase